MNASNTVETAVLISFRDNNETVSHRLRDAYGVWKLNNRTDYAYVGSEVLTVVVMQSTVFWDITPCSPVEDRLCGLVVRVSGYRSRGPGFDFRRFQIFWEAAGLERGPLSLVRTTKKLLGGKSSGSGPENRD
jgi:hypothetical protein